MARPGRAQPGPPCPRHRAKISWPAPCWRPWKTGPGGAGAGRGWLRAGLAKGVRQGRPSAGADELEPLSRFPRERTLRDRHKRTPVPLPSAWRGARGSRVGPRARGQARPGRGAPAAHKDEGPGGPRNPRAGTQSGGGGVWAGARRRQSRGPWGVARR